MIDRGLFGQDKFKFNHLSGPGGSSRTWDHMRLNDYAFRGVLAYGEIGGGSRVTADRYFPLRSYAHTRCVRG